MNGSKAPTVVVYGSRTEAACRKRLASLEKPILVYQADADFPQELLSEGISLCVDTDFLDVDDYDNIELFCGYFRENWCVVNGQDLSEWKGYSLAKGVSGLNVYLRLVPILRNGLIAGRLFAAVRPKEIVIGDGVGVEREVWRDVALRRGIPITVLDPDPALDVETEWNPEAGPSAPVALRMRLVSTVYRAWMRIKRAAESARYLLHDAYLAMQDRPRLLVIADRRNEIAQIGLDDRLWSLPDVRVTYPGSFAGKRIARRHFGRSSEEAQCVLEQRWKKLAAAAVELKPYKFEGVSIWSWISNWIEEIFLRDLPEAAGIVSVAERTIESFKPALVSGKEDRGDSRTLWFMAARKSGIPVAAIQRECRVPGSLKGYPEIACDWLLSIGPSSAEWFASSGMAPERLIDVGDPRSHWRNGMPDFIPAEVRRELGFDDRPVILFADGQFKPSTGNDSPLFVRRTLVMIRDLARELSEINFLIKFHPSSSHEEGEGHIQRRVNLLREFDSPNLKIAPLRSSSLKYLSIADAVVSARSSSVGLEAMAINIPVIYIHPDEMGFTYPFFDPPRKGALRAQNYDELKRLVTDVASRKEAIKNELAVGQQEFLRYLYSPPRDTLTVLRELVHRVIREKAAVRQRNVHGAEERVPPALVAEPVALPESN